MHNQPVIVPDIGHTIIFTGVPSQIYIFPFLWGLFSFHTDVSQDDFKLRLTWLSQTLVVNIWFFSSWNDTTQREIICVMTCFYCVYKWYQVNNLLEGKSKRQVDGRLLFNNRPGCSDFFEEKNSDLNFEVKTYLQSQNNTSQGCCKRTVNHSIISAPQVLQHILNIIKCSQYFWELKRREKLSFFSCVENQVNREDVLLQNIVLT